MNKTISKILMTAIRMVIGWYLMVGVKDGVYTIYGLFDMKYFRDENLDCLTNHATEKTYPLMRYAEVLLLASEANLMTGNQAKADE
jgi:hypothetical protein